MNSPLAIEPLFSVAGIAITGPVVVTWFLMVLLAAGSFLITRNLSLFQPGKAQALLELVVVAIDGQIKGTIPGDPKPYRPLIATLFLYILVANWSSLIPGIEPPTAHLETDAALALLVLIATIGFGIHAHGLLGYLKTFAEPTWVMTPLNLIEQITRTFSLLVRLFGNVMSGVFVISIVLSLAGLLVPIPLMALDMLTGAVQAYIFAVLAMVFIGAAVGEGHSAPSGAKDKQKLET